MPQVIKANDFNQSLKNFMWRREAIERTEMDTCEGFSALGIRFGHGIETLMVSKIQCVLGLLIHTSHLEVFSLTFPSSYMIVMK